MEQFISNILEQLKPWRDAHKRSTWKPIVEAGDKGIIASKFSGKPWLAENEAYPCCGDCQTPMSMLLQLNLNQIPPQLSDQFGKGLLQLFYCFQCSSYAPFENNKLVRIVEPNQLISPVTHQDEDLPPKTIVGWTELDDYPDSVEAEDYGYTCEYYYDYTEEFMRIECPEYGIVIETPADDDLEDDFIFNVVEGDKLAGYPNWIQGVEYPNCPECQRRMQFVFQIDSQDHLPVLFGDVGCGHITQCPEHKQILTFSWACS